MPRTTITETSLSRIPGTATNYSAPSAITTANALTTSMGYDAQLNPTSATNPNGGVASSVYDSSSRPTSTTSPYGGVTNYTYSASAPQVTATTGSEWTQTTYDGLGRTKRVANGYSSTTVSYTDTVYDTCGCTPTGKPYQTSVPYAPGSTPAWKVNTYDAIGRTLTTVAPDGISTTTYSYAGDMVTVTDPVGKWKQYTTDAYGQLVQVVEPSPNPGTEPNHVTTYTYDVLGHLTQAQMPRTINGQVVTQVRTWAYDPITQLLTQTTTPEAGTTTFTYNSDGTLATKTDAKSQQSQYTYDPYGRLIQIARGTVSNGQFTENVSQRATLSYDGTNGGFSSNTAGLLSSVAYTVPHGLNVTEMYSYHSAGAVTAKRMQLSGTALSTYTANFDVSYVYNDYGQVAHIQYPFAQWSNGTVTTAGPLYQYGYDSMNRLNSMTGPNSQTLVSSVPYGPANQILQLNAAAFTETRTYNANLQLTELVSGGYHFKYNYSATQNNGRIASTTDVVSGESITYAYGTLNRLTQASGSGDPTGSWSQTFGYDGFGNLVSKTGANAPNNAFLSADPATNRLNSGGAAYDANGNLTAYGTGSSAATYAYDIENRLSNATPLPGGNQVLYGYDNANQRVYQGTYAPGTGSYSNEQIYFYGAEGKKLIACSIQNSGGTVTISATATNIWFAGRLLAPEDRLQSQGKYFPYGEDRYNPNPANPSSDQEKFGTYTRDSATLLDYAYQRYYNPQLGRFHTPDPLPGAATMASPQTWNRFSYVGNDPANYFDASGNNRVVGGVWMWMLGGGGASFVDDGEGPEFAGAFDTYVLSFIPLYGPSLPEGPDCDKLARSIKLPGTFDGFNYTEAQKIWNDGNLAKLANGATIAALAAVAWQGESSFSLAPKNTVNGPGSVDVGPFQINTQYYYGKVANSAAVFGTNIGTGVFKGNADANIAEGISILEIGYKAHGDDEAGLYTGRNNPARPKRQNTYNQLKNRLINFFSNKQCF